MKTLSFISGVLVAFVLVAPSQAYFTTYEGPADSGTVRMTYVRGRGIRVHQQRPVAQSLPKYIVRTGDGVPSDWPEWIDPPSWIVGN